MSLINITQEHLEHARIPPKYWPALLKHVPDSMTYKRDVKTYLAHMPTFLGDGIGLYLWSVENSTGKTSLAVVCMKRAMQLKYSTLFITSEDFKNSLIERTNFSESESFLGRAMNVDLLIIDDLTKEYRPAGKSDNTSAKGFAETKIEALIRYRTQHLKTTLFTANRNPKELKTIYGNDMSAMLRAAMKPIEVKGIDWRANEEKKINQLFRELGEEQ